MSKQITITASEWVKTGEALYGPDKMAWRFVCPVCGHVASVRDWMEAGAPEGAVGFSCVGRYLPERSEAFSKNPGPCNYAGGGLFKLNPVTVDGVGYFAFADSAPCEASS